MIIYFFLWCIINLHLAILMSGIINIFKIPSMTAGFKFPGSHLDEGSGVKLCMEKDAIFEILTGLHCLFIDVCNFAHHTARLSNFVFFLLLRGTNLAYFPWFSCRSNLLLHPLEYLSEYYLPWCQSVSHYSQHQKLGLILADSFMCWTSRIFPSIFPNLPCVCTWSLLLLVLFYFCIFQNVFKKRKYFLDCKSFWASKYHLLAYIP